MDPSYVVDRNLDPDQTIGMWRKFLSKIFVINLNFHILFYCIFCIWARPAVRHLARLERGSGSPQINLPSFAHWSKGSCMTRISWPVGWVDFLIQTSSQVRYINIAVGQFLFVLFFCFSHWEILLILISFYYNSLIFSTRFLLFFTYKVSNLQTF